LNRRQHALEDEPDVDDELRSRLARMSDRALLEFGRAANPRQLRSRSSISPLGRGSGEMKEKRLSA
jgi:hypothetical protein